jgi:hypothetical protein
MADLMSRVRAWLGIGAPSDPDHIATNLRLARQTERIRLAVIDADLPFRERWRRVADVHPTRRVTDELP